MSATRPYARWLERLFQVIFWMALISSLIVANLPQPPMAGELNDKPLHMLAFAVLASLIALAYPHRPGWFLFLVLALFGALIEFAQMFAGLGRQGSFDDWIADLLAAGGVLLAIGMVRMVVFSKSE